MEEVPVYRVTDYRISLKKEMIKNKLKEKVEEMHFAERITPDVYQELIVLVKQL